MIVEVLERPSELARTCTVSHTHHLLERRPEGVQKQLVICGVAGYQVCSVRNVIGSWIATARHGCSGRGDGGEGSTVLTSGSRRVDYADVVCEHHVGVQHDMRSTSADPVGEDLGVRQDIALVDPLLSN